VVGGGERADGSGEVESDRGQDQPGRVGREGARGQVRDWPALQIGDDLFDDRVPAVVTLGVEHR